MEVIIVDDKKLSYEEYIDKRLDEADKEIASSAKKHDLDEVLDEMERNIINAFEKRNQKCIS